MRNYFYFLFFVATTTSAGIALNQAANEVPPVIVKNIKKFHHSLTSGSQSIIDKETIDHSGASNLADVLSQLGDVQLHDISGNSSQVLLGMRGFGANATSNTLLLINGIPITNPDMAPPDLNVIPLNAIQQVEVIAGSESVLYGDQAVGGTINIVTQDTGKEAVQMSCGAGSYHQYLCNLMINNHYQKLNYNIDLSKNHTDNYREHNVYNQDGLIGRMDYSYATGTLRFNYKIANENMQYPGALTATQVREDRRMATNDTDFFRDLSGIFQVQNIQALNEHWQLETDIARRDMSGNGVLYSSFTQSRATTFLRPQIKGHYDLATVTTGLDLQADQYRLNSDFGLTDDSQQKYGIFGAASIPYKQMIFSLGARGAQQISDLESFNNSHTLNRAFASTLGVTLPLNENQQFYLRRAGSFRFPKADENASTPPGVTSLRTQRGVSYETGYEIKETRYSGKIGLYQLNLRDEIAFDPTQTPEQPFGSNTNLAPTVRRGFTLSGNTHLTEQWMIGSQYNYVNARFQSGADEGNLIPLVSENIIRINTDYQITPQWDFYSEALFTGSQFAANDNANVSGKAGGYTTFNANLRYVYHKFTAAFRINNIFNKEYYFYTVYEPSIQSEFFYPAPERNMMLTLSYLFD